MQQEAYIWSTAITCLFSNAMLLITLASSGAPQDPTVVYFMSLFSRIKGGLSPNMGAEKIMSPRAGNVGNNDQPPAYT